LVRAVISEHLQKILQQLDKVNRAYCPIIDELQEHMVDNFYVNFSLFRSIPKRLGHTATWFQVLLLEESGSAAGRKSAAA
jgi:arginine decarboxylase-like protein